MCTKTKACLTCLVCWLFGFAVTTPVLVWTSFTPDDEAPLCLTSVDSLAAKSYFILIIALFFLVPLVILVVMYRLIARQLVPQKYANSRAAQDNPDYHGEQVSEVQYIHAWQCRVSFDKIGTTWTFPE